MKFTNAIRSLSDAGVDFVVIGGFSAILHGSMRTTYDLDICYSREAGNLRRLAAALAPFHPRLRGVPPDLPFLWDEATLRQTAILTLQTDIGEIDLLTEVPGVGAYAEVKMRSITVEIFERHVLTLGLSTLIQAKRATGREKDKSALPELESLLETRGW